MNSDWRSKAVSPELAVSYISSGHAVFIHGACATPHALVDAMAGRQDVENVKLYHLHLSGSCPFAAPGLEHRFHSISLFTSAALREPIANGRADFVPVFLSDIPGLFKDRDIELDVALVQVSPPDAHGYCSLGVSVDAARAALESAPIVIAEINEQMPRTHGQSFVHINAFKAYVHTNRPLTEHENEPETSVEASIGTIIADLVEDGSTLQVGIGGIPNAVLSRLKNKNDLGVHTEMFSDGVIDLVQRGNINNSRKDTYNGSSVTSFVIGSKKLFDFVDDNPTIQFLACDVTNDTSIIRRNERFVAINSALQIDLSGQVCADSFGHRIYSGIGGQMDFLRGAALSKGGKPIIALPSVAKGGAISRIVLELSPGAGVVTTRGHVHWVATEYGAVNLHGKSLRQRAELLISIAHPDFRSELQSQIKQVRHFAL